MKLRFGFVSNSSSSSFLIFVNDNCLTKLSTFYEEIFDTTINNEINFEKLIFGVKLFQYIKKNSIGKRTLKSKINRLVLEDLFINNFLTFDILFNNKSKEEIVDFISNMKSMQDVPKEYIIERVEKIENHKNFYNFIERFRKYYIGVVEIDITSVLHEIVYHFYKDDLEFFYADTVSFDNDEYDLDTIKNFLINYESKCLFFEGD